MQTSEAGTLFRDGKLAQAIAAASAVVKQTPTDTGARLLLAELLLFDGKLERADTMLDTASTIDPAAALVLAEFRQLLRAEKARQQVMTENRVPEFLGQPTPTQTHILQALVALRPTTPPVLPKPRRPPSRRGRPSPASETVCPSRISGISTIYALEASRCSPRPESIFGSRPSRS
ncbi:MAG: tetratricopeptide repeat protein [Aliidongia sp.]